MKFKVKIADGFRHGQQHYEEGNNYDSVKHELTDAEVDLFHKAGWVSVEGKDEVDTDIHRHVTLQVENITHDVGVKVNG